MPQPQILQVVKRQDTATNGTSEQTMLDHLARALKPEVWWAIAETSPATANHHRHAEKSKVVLWVQSKSFAELKCEYRLSRLPEAIHKYATLETLVAANKAAKPQPDCFENPVFRDQWDQSTEETLRFCREKALPTIFNHLSSARARGVWASVEMTLTFLNGARTGTRYALDEGANPIHDR